MTDRIENSGDACSQSQTAPSAPTRAQAPFGEHAVERLIASIQIRGMRTVRIDAPAAGGNIRPGQNFYSHFPAPASSATATRGSIAMPKKMCALVENRLATYAQGNSQPKLIAITSSVTGLCPCHLRARC